EHGLWDGSKLTVQKDSWVLFAGAISETSTHGPFIYSYVGGSDPKVIGVADASVGNYHFAGFRKVPAGQSLSIRASAGMTLNNSSTIHHVEFAVWPDFSTFGVYGEHQILTETSSEKTPGTSGDYLSMTGNSLPLPEGTWEVWGEIDFGASGGSPAYSVIEY